MAARSPAEAKPQRPYLRYVMTSGAVALATTAFLARSWLEQQYSNISHLLNPPQPIPTLSAHPTNTSLPPTLTETATFESTDTKTPTPTTKPFPTSTPPPEPTNSPTESPTPQSEIFYYLNEAKFQEMRNQLSSYRRASWNYGNNNYEKRIIEGHGGNIFLIGARVLDDPASKEIRVDGMFIFNGNIFQVEDIIVAKEVNENILNPELDLARTPENLLRLQATLSSYIIGRAFNEPVHLVFFAPQAGQNTNDVCKGYESYHGVISLSVSASRCKRPLTSPPGAPGDLKFILNGELSRKSISIDDVAPDASIASLWGQLDPLQIENNMYAALRLPLNANDFSTEPAERP